MGESTPDRRWLGIWAVVSLPVVVAVIRGLNRGYLLVGDNALIGQRALDVGTRNHPFLGTWSSVSNGAGLDINHPGPLVFDIVALPARVLGMSVGVAIGVALFQILMLFVAIWSARRIGGFPCALTVGVAMSVLVWTLGSEMLYDPWQPNLLVLPFAVALMAAWATLAGHHSALPVVVALSSFAVQTHLSYILLAPMLVVLASGATVWRRRERGAMRSLAVAGIVLVLCWSQPLIEEFFGSGKGNLSRIVSGALEGSGDSQAIGPRLGLRLIASIWALPPFWVGSRYSTAVPRSTWVGDGPDRTLVVGHLIGTGLALVVVAAMIAVVGVLAWLAFGRRDRSVFAGIVVAVCAGVTAFVTMLITPIDELGLSAHKIRWLWSIGAVGAAAVGWAIVSLVRRRSPGSARPAVGVALAAIGALTLAAIPYTARPEGPVANTFARPIVDDLSNQTAAASGMFGDDTVEFDPTRLLFAEPYSAPIISVLLRNGVDVVFADHSLVRQFGDNRASSGDAEWRLEVLEGGLAVSPPAGSQRIAYVPALREPEQAELESLLGGLSDAFASDPPRPVGNGPVGIDLGDPNDVQRALLDGSLFASLAGGTAETDLDTGRAMELQALWLRVSVAVVVTPAGAP